MANDAGRFIWYELMTTDTAAAQTFYRQVVGWGATDAQMPGMPYWMFNMNEQPVAGLMDLPEQARSMVSPPVWMGYVTVDDVDASVAQVRAKGGAVYVPPTDIPNMGRFSIVADPAGAAFGLWRSANPAQDTPPDMTAPGRVGWNELYGADPTTGFDFYASLFGWEKKDSMEMGDMGVYQIFGPSDAALGGMMRKPEAMPVGAWGYYFNVSSVEEAAERVKAAGGQVVLGPMEVPGGQWMLQGVDPQGAHFGLLGTK